MKLADMNVRGRTSGGRDEIRSEPSYLKSNARSDLIWSIAIGKGKGDTLTYFWLQLGCVMTVGFTWGSTVENCSEGRRGRAMGVRRDDLGRRFQIWMNEYYRIEQSQSEEGQGWHISKLWLRSVVGVQLSADRWIRRSDRRFTFNWRESAIGAIRRGVAIGSIKVMVWSALSCQIWRRDGRLRSYREMVRSRIRS